MNSIAKAVKAIRELGLSKISLFAIYKFGLITGHYRRSTPSLRDHFTGTVGIGPYPSYPQVSEGTRDRAIIAADNIIKKSIEVFGALHIPLDLSLGNSSKHWSTLEKTPPEQDIKFIWEPARFGWAVTLARAYGFSGNPVYAKFFWEQFNQFINLHPPNLGRQWQSAQEVAIRLMVWTFCDRVFASAPSSTPDNRQRLWQAIAEHAHRIPPTLVYARAQNNNHLVSEAVGLYTAGLYLTDHPQASKWHTMGWRWLNWSFQNQIDEFGTYTQHSVNYHRLLLQLALFADHFRRLGGDPDWPDKTRERLQAATLWLWALTDPETGETPNLGANDGALVFPLSNQPFKDYRPTVDAAFKAFLHKDIYNNPKIAEFANWFDLSAHPDEDLKVFQASDMLRLDKGQGRAFFRVAHYQDRPSHADQLHVDLWHQGVNVGMDPGTFQYNALPPWDNALTSTEVHNTLQINGQDQMLKSGRFLWLNWAQGEVITHEVDQSGIIKRVVADHNGYHRIGACHKRCLQSTENGWVIIDSVLPYKKTNEKIYHVQISWLLPDWHYQLKAENCLLIQGPQFSFKLIIEEACELNLFRGGERLHGELESQPTWGWFSPTYAVKQPALMVVAVKRMRLPINLSSIWLFNS
jgi:hypothetical protein